MTNRGKNNSSSPLSETFQNESSYLNSPNSIPNNVGGGFSLPSYQIPIHNNNYNNNQTQTQAQGQAADPEPEPRGRPQIQAQAQLQADSEPRPRGRPLLGSKNKPELNLSITEKELEKHNQMVMCHFAPGIDVVGQLKNFADEYNAGIHVISASGKIASATLLDLSHHHPDPNVVFPYAGAPTRTLQGPLTLVELTGCYISCFPDNIGAAADSYSLDALLNDDHTTLHQMMNKESFGIAFEGSRPGETIREIVGGKIVAGSTGVMVTFNMFSNKNVMYYKEKPNNNAGGAGGAADADGASGSGGKNNMAES